MLLVKMKLQKLQFIHLSTYIYLLFSTSYLTSLSANQKATKNQQNVLYAHDWSHKTQQLNTDLQRTKCKKYNKIKT